MNQELVEKYKDQFIEKVETTKKENNDEYYDTRNLDLYKTGGSLRIRKIEQKGKEKIRKDD